MGRNLPTDKLSLVNSALYFYRNNSYRKAALKLLRFGKPQEIEPVAHIGRHDSRHRDSVASIDVGELVDRKSPSPLSSRDIWTQEHTAWNVSGQSDGQTNVSSIFSRSSDNLPHPQKPVIASLATD